MPRYGDTPYYVHNMPNTKFGYSVKSTPTGSWRPFNGQANRFYQHYGPFHDALHSFTPRPRYHANPRMNAHIQTKHKNAYNRLMYRRGTTVGNFGMQETRNKVNWGTGEVIEKSFPKEFLSILRSEFARKRKEEKSLTDQEIKEAAGIRAEMNGTKGEEATDTIYRRYDTAEGSEGGPASKGVMMSK